MQILQQLGSGEGLPTGAIRAATADRSTVAPLLLEAFDRYQPGNEVEEQGLFIAFHLLGQWHEKSAYRTLARFLRRPEADLVLGDATTATSHRVMANLFDGDPQPIYDIIRDSDANDYLRWSMFDALVILVFRGELDRATVSAFLQAVFHDLTPQDASPAWDGWQGAVALLALSELAPLVREAFRRGFIDGTAISPENFEDDLKRACAGRPPRHAKEYEPFGDVIEELSSWAGFQPKQARDQIASSRRPDPWRLGTPAHNPLRNVGRNDPCPCGSGKKFKKCCLGKEPPQILAPIDPYDLDAMPEFDDADLPILDYDPLVAPDPEEWLAADEQTRIDAVEYYHRDDDLEGGRAAVHATMHAIVENQIAASDCLPVRHALHRLMDEGLDRHQAIHAIASVLAVHINELMRAVKDGAPAPEQSGRDPNVAYFAEVEKLTAEDWLRSG